MKGEAQLRLNISQDTLAQGLNITGRATSARNTLPVLADVLLQATEDGSLRLSATDLEIGITCQLECQVEKPGAIAVPARTLADLVATLPKAPVSLSLKKTSLEVACGSSKASLKGVPAEEFPPIPQINTPGLSLQAAEFKTLVQRVVFAACSDEARPVLGGVLLVIEGQSLTLAAADGFRLSECRLNLAQPAPRSLRCIIPARALAELARITGEAESLAIILPEGRSGQVVFRLPGIDLVTQLVEGGFPDYQQIVPRKFTTRLTANTAALLKACKQAEIFARENGKAARLSIKPGQVEVHGHSEETGSTGATLEAAVEGPDLEIAFNVAFLREALGVIRTPSVALEATAANSPGVFRPVGEDGFLHVIMPIHLGS